MKSFGLGTWEILVVNFAAFCCIFAHFLFENLPIINFETLATRCSRMLQHFHAFPLWKSTNGSILQYFRSFLIWKSTNYQFWNFGDEIWSTALTRIYIAPGPAHPLRRACTHTCPPSHAHGYTVDINSPRLSSFGEKIWRRSIFRIHRHLVYDRSVENLLRFVTEKA